MSIQRHALLALLLPLGALNVQAASTSDDVVIPQKSTAQFLDKVPNYAGGAPSPSITHSTANLGAPSNPSSSAAIGSLDAPPQARIQSNALQGGGKIEPRKLENRNIEKRTTGKLPVQHNSIKSTWY